MIDVSLAEEYLTNLRAMKELYSDENNWTKKHYAKNRHGESITVNSKAARCWCLTGSIGKVCPQYIKPERIQAELCIGFQATLDDRGTSFINWLEIQAIEFMNTYKPEKYEILDNNYKGNPVVRFNDHPATTWEDVNLFLDYCIKELEQ